ncbi:hypothetical protein JMJ35_003736 [Cladonia borealis]|uniref:Uncharacterized protein n=1 Tax=Cladonia borealis TaxID=184061 RepID=A0AA39R584_9LECA|nr:hypothetical protein JMJ35_003736 [Cladonia borealis]
MQIWNPASLVRKNIKENRSISDNALYLAATEGGMSAFASKIEDLKADVHYDVSEGNDETDVNPAIIHPETQTLALDVRYASGYVSSSSIFPLDLSKITLLSDLQYCKNIIGVSKRTRSFVLLNQSSWLCSTDLANLALDRYI